MTEPLHPLFVHAPLALAALMPLFALGLWIAQRRGWAGAWWLAVVLQVGLALSAFAAQWSGEQDEERVEAVVAHDTIHEHEEAAEAFTWTAAAVAGIFLVGGLLRRRAAFPALAAVSLLGTVGVLALGLRAGHLGGELVYRYGAAAAWTGSAPPGGGAKETEEKGSDDTDGRHDEGHDD